MKKGYKKYVVQYYVDARNAPEAIRLAKKAHSAEVFINKSDVEPVKSLAEPIGFDDGHTEDEEDEEE